MKRRQLSGTTGNACWYSCIGRNGEIGLFVCVLNFVLSHNGEALEVDIIPIDSIYNYKLYRCYKLGFFSNDDALTGLPERKRWSIFAYDRHQ